MADIPSGCSPGQQHHRILPATLEPAVGEAHQEEAEAMPIIAIEIDGSISCGSDQVVNAGRGRTWAERSRA